MIHGSDPRGIGWLVHQLRRVRPVIHIGLG